MSRTPRSPVLHGTDEEHFWIFVLGIVQGLDFPGGSEPAINSLQQPWDGGFCRIFSSSGSVLFCIANGIVSAVDSSGICEMNAKMVYSTELVVESKDNWKRVA